MLEQEALVISATVDVVTVEVQSQSACSSCEAKSGCGTGSLSRVLGRKPIRLDVDNHLRVMVGDKVIIGLEEQTLLLGSLLIYLLPLVLLFIVALAGQYLAQGLGIQGEWLVVTGGIAGLVAGLSLVRNFSARSDGNRISKPVLLRRQKTVIPAQAGIYLKYKNDGSPPARG
ncbi:MAG: SoxR reducing system RseC family protein [Gammaproteobacteria bacterium]|nr:SoxR reducing system RseC family protein [Gammaproteobacteria bacterium]